jgi:eukaryotic-like serine/threonine-protein kinase
MAATQIALPSRFELPELVAHGGMGDVFRATDTALERTVAIKVLAERYARDAEFRARFTREARTAAQLSGEPNVVLVFDVGDAGGLPFIVMEYLPGGSVADRLHAGPVAPAQALAWLEQAGRALDAAHVRGIVHRDVKPANLLLGADGEIRVTDFGIARAASHDTLTGIGTILGTAGYMAPEQAHGERATAASDRYALGCVAFELLTGRRPFAAESVTAEAAAHASAPIPSAHAVARDLPTAIDQVFVRALAKAPDDRYASCAEVVADLRRAFHDAATETRPVVPVPAPGPPASTAVTRLASPAGRRRVRWALAAAAAVALAAAGFALALVGATGGDTPRTVIRVETRTETVEGEQRVTTVTEPQSETPSEASGADLNDQGFRLMQARDYQGALPLLEQAVGKLQGTGAVAEAWASYNLALTRFALGQCDGVVDLLDRSQEVQGKRKEIERLRKQVEKGCESNPGHGNGGGQDEG